MLVLEVAAGVLIGQTIYMSVVTWMYRRKRAKFNKALDDVMHEFARQTTTSVRKEHMS